jgi:hypothetical protein
MAAFLEAADGRKTRRAIFRLHARNNFAEAAWKIFPGNRLELCGIKTDKHRKPRIPGTWQ